MKQFVDKIDYRSANDNGFLRISLIFFDIASKITDKFPRFGAKLLNSICHLAGNKLFIKMSLTAAVHQLKKTNLKELKRILVISDLNIGDAVNLQVAVSAIRDYLPDIEIDYLINNKAEGLILGNPDITHLLSILSGSPLPNRSDLDNVKKVIVDGNYDIIFNFCPFFSKKSLKIDKGIFINTTALIYMFLYNDKTKAINHVLYQVDSLVHSLLSAVIKLKRKRSFGGTNLYLSDAAVDVARKFLTYAGILDIKSIIMYNPDSTSPFTRIPLSDQVTILKKVLSLSSVKIILLGAGHSIIEIEKMIIDNLSDYERKKICVIPASMPITAYSALIDFADIYLTGDTGPMHIAASYKHSNGGRYKFRNKTAVFSIFGATPSKIYGYDSHSENYFSSNQDAPSYCYTAESLCRNITCINKRAKTCKNVKCFDFLDTKKISDDIISILKGTSKNPICSQHYSRYANARQNYARSY